SQMELRKEGVMALLASLPTADSSQLTGEPGGGPVSCRLRAVSFRPDRQVSGVRYRKLRGQDFCTDKHPRFVCGDLSGERGCGDRQWRCQPEFSGAGAAFVVAIDRADRHLVARLGDAGTATDAGAASGI